METEQLQNLTQKFELLVNRWGIRNRKIQEVPYKAGLDVLSKISMYEYQELTDTQG